MPESIQQLRERRAVIAIAMRALLDDNPGDKWTPALNDQYETGINEIDALDAGIGRVQALIDREAASVTQVHTREVPIGQLDPLSSAVIYDTWLRGGDKRLSSEQHAHIRNTMSTTTDSEGGYSVQTDVATRITDALAAFGGMRAVSQVIRTAQGNSMSFPTSDGTSETGEQIAENTTATGDDIVLGTKALDCYKFSSKVVAVPIELLQDSTVDLEAFIESRLVQRLGRITNQRYTTGTGSSQPNGVVTAAGAGKTGTTGQTVTVIFDDVVDLVHSVDPAYRAPGNCRFQMNDASVAKIRKLKDDNSRPIWTPGYEANVPGGVPDQLLGYPVAINQDIAVMAASAKSILFGDFTHYVIRDALDIILYRFTDSAYAKLGQVGFLALMRSGGNLVDVGGAIKHYANSAS